MRVRFDHPVGLLPLPNLAEAFRRVKSGVVWLGGLATFK